MDDVPKALRDDLATSYRSLPSTADDTRRYAQRVLSGNTAVDTPPYRTLGLATSKQVARINALARGRDVAGFDFALDPAGIRHARSRHADVVDAADYALLPEMLNSPNATIKNAEGGMETMQIPGIVMTARLDGRLFRVVWGIRTRRKMLVLHSFTADKKKP